MTTAGDAATFSVRLDRPHRHWPLALLILLEVFVVWSMTLTWAWHHVPRYLAAAVLGGGLGWLMWWGYRRCRIRVFADGVAEQGHIWCSTTRFADVLAVQQTLESDSLDPFEASGIGEFFALVFAQFTVRPFRWILRRFVYGAQSDVFYRGVFELLGDEGKTLLRIEASSGWENVEELFARIRAAFDAHRERVDQARVHRPTD